MVAEQPIRRMWLIFFGNSVPTFWSRMLRPGFRHVCAAAYFDDQERWVYVDACRAGTVVEVLRPDEFGPRFQQLLCDSHAVLRIGAQFGRTRAPVSFFCVGGIKGLLGVRCWAATPYGLFQALLALGAEKVEPPHVVAIQQSERASGRSRDEEAA